VEETRGCFFFWTFSRCCCFRRLLVGLALIHLGAARGNFDGVLTDLRVVEYLALTEAIFDLEQAQTHTRPNFRQFHRSFLGLFCGTCAVMALNGLLPCLDFNA